MSKWEKMRELKIKREGTNSGRFKKKKKKLLFCIIVNVCFCPFLSEYASPHIRLAD